MKTKIQKIYRAVYKSIAKKDSLKNFKAILVKTINEAYPCSTNKEKLAMYRSALELRRTGDTRKNLEGIIKSENYIIRSQGIRAKQEALKNQIQESREAEEPVIFYLCSHHANPAKDHEFWEAKIYVDKFWRRTVQDVYPTETVKAIEKYIRDNGIYTVQYITGDPVYLITRPYCRHYFIPVLTSEVLGSDLKTIKKNHPEGIMWYRHLNDNERELRFQKKRALVSRTLASLPVTDSTEQWLGSKPYSYRNPKKIRGS